MIKKYEKEFKRILSRIDFIKGIFTIESNIKFNLKKDFYEVYSLIVYILKIFYSKK
ncbi:hypothetical protein LEP1GSC021_2217 [Leptospira noguchii str. 1993005606]|uniref:Uncharacterized protein n=2 Tax=Leptospira noguchii TaxID=28182 RepID=M6UCX4_9LEPT|nr:hypothetical protein LEP1GSC041_3537 [Leptospira noguchii str. 2006001870]EMM99306.1 hypothetical protein LEP1GSC035_2674 [Leptospira noguchii str. 2007001578]EMO38934.1 hypothetical protein LEP1GSC186_0132 [Leptospira noguchii serovar Autumnalis str. ZUN142]EMS85665.1 hypothetical protein LEP1GSC074_3934 [Leptospira noguchii str. Hook]EPE84147.1 hypothetical protein LEP1GSC021_2217 [Leptospira noguchii str. 1993005606]